MIGKLTLAVSAAIMFVTVVANVAIADPIVAVLTDAATSINIDDESGNCHLTFRIENRGAATIRDVEIPVSARTGAGYGLDHVGDRSIRNLDGSRFVDISPGSQMTGVPGVVFNEVCDSVREIAIDPRGKAFCETDAVLSEAQCRGRISIESEMRGIRVSDGATGSRRTRRQ